jgi:surface carbohydrate biosynthesis protein
MSRLSRFLIIPVENQVRELDGKLLFACIAARRGFSSMIGSRGEVDFRLGRVPRAIYVAKSMTPRSKKVFRILRLLGHELVGWDEEALNPFALPEVYYSRRFSARTFSALHHLLAWGEADAELFRKYPHYPGTPIHVTGNPRGDLLRPELRPFYAADAERCRAKHGDFVLINTNFAHVNAYYPVLNLLVPSPGGGPSKIGRAGIGMTRAYVEGRAAHKQRVFEAFQELIAFLHDRFPQLTVVVRPHPIENPAVYHALAERHARVVVEKDGGNPIPWLLSTRALVHCSCTTGVESWIAGTPTLAYRPDPSESYEEPLANALSHSCFDLEQVASTLDRVLAGELGRLEGEEQRRLVARHLEGLSGPFASDRILDVLERIVAEGGDVPTPSRRQRVEGRARGLWRRFDKEMKARRPDSKNRPEFQRYRYPGLEPDAVRERIDRFQEILGDPRPIRVTRMADHVYRLDP